MAPISSDNDSGITGGAKFVTSTIGNTVGGLGRTVGGVAGAGGRGLGQTVTGATGSAGKPVGDAIESLGNGVESGAKSVSKGVEDAGKTGSTGFVGELLTADSMDAAPDIYETPELTDDSITNTATTAIRSVSTPTSDFSEGEDASIDRQRLDPDGARTRFLPQGRIDSGYVDRVGSKRKSYWISSKRIQKDALQDSDEEISDDEKVESTERKLARLKREVAEVKEALEKQKNSTTSGKEFNNRSTQDTLKSVDSLSHILDGVGSFTIDGFKRSAYRMSQGLSERYEYGHKPAENVSAQSAQLTGDKISSADLTLGPQQSHMLSKVSDFDKRLAILEAALGLESISVPTQDDSTLLAVVPTLNELERQVTIISKSDDSSLNKIGQQVRQLTQEAEKLYEARKSIDALDSASRSVIDRPDEVTSGDSQKYFEEVQDNRLNSKVNALYGTLGTIESLAPLLPSVLDRLRSLRAIHANAALANDTLLRAETRQATMAEDIKDWQEALEKVEKAFEQGATTMKENTRLVEDWIHDLEARIRNLDQ
ncbi:MAG: hypothetical protein Q9167_003818 [Letrouitia subvulpina]